MDRLRFASFPPPPICHKPDSLKGAQPDRLILLCDLGMSWQGG